MSVLLELTTVHRTSSVLTCLGVLFVNALAATDYQIEFVKVMKTLTLAIQVLIEQAGIASWL